MARTIGTALALVFMLQVHGSANAADTTPATQTAARIEPCVNMANQLEATNEGDWGPAITDRDFTDIARAGFETVRVPVRFAGHAGASAPYTIDPAFLARVDHVVTAARKAGLRVILDLHNYKELMADPAGNTARFTALWRQVAEHFRGFDDKVWFELLNEPNDKLDDTALTGVITPALAAVRESNPTRKVVIGGQKWSGIDSLATVPLPNDPNLVYTFHYYEPFAFTHQGAHWVSPPQPLGRTYPAAGDADMLARDVAKARAFMARTGQPLFMGEYGAYEVIPLDQRAAWTKAIHDAYAAAGIDGCVWGYANTFPIRVKGVWQAPILRAIGL